VNAIMPGLMNTLLIFQQIFRTIPRCRRHGRGPCDAACPTGMMGTAWDIAKAALLLASDDAAYSCRAA
jgi:NAD(P)-dependent dehydrogenase (short-subunit alcohol dehydrogenase family)